MSVVGFYTDSQKRVRPITQSQRSSMIKRARSIAEQRQADWRKTRTVDADTVHEWMAEMADELPGMEYRQIAHPGETGAPYHGVIHTQNPTATDAYVNSVKEAASDPDNPHLIDDEDLGIILETGSEVCEGSIAYPAYTWQEGPQGDDRILPDYSLFSIDWPTARLDCAEEEAFLKRQGCRVTDNHLHFGTIHIHAECPVKNADKVMRHIAEY